MIVLCEVDNCAYCRDGQCGKESISHKMQTFSGFRSGERERSPACADYKEVNDGLSN